MPMVILNPAIVLKQLTHRNMESPHDPAQNHNPADTSGKPGDLSFDVLSRNDINTFFSAV